MGTRLSIFPDFYRLRERERCSSRYLRAVPPKKGKIRRTTIPDWLADKLISLLPFGLTYPKTMEYLIGKAKLTKLYKPGWGLHTLRRCHATYMKSEGLQESLGHASSKTTEIYIRPTQEMRLKSATNLRNVIFPVLSGDCQ